MTNVQPQMVVTTEWLAQSLNDGAVHILDVTTLEQYKKGHIPGAVLLDSKKLMTRRGNVANELPSVKTLEFVFRDAGITPLQNIILTSDDPLLATRAWFTLDYLGWGDRAAILDGGNVKWAAERRALTTVFPAVKHGDFVATVNPDALISRDQLKTLLSSGQPYVLLDARDPKHYLGHQKGDEVRHAGHIPTAECLPQTSNTLVNRKGVTTLKPASELADIYASLNVKSTDQRVIVYCRSGVEATMNYFVLRYLGFHPTLYDGSYVEWNKSEPVASAEP